ncbi:hypothetical protein [Rhodococcus olei]|uniref:hypothetical protein n=1 Tax=Rhodococcus olei TaxID=2161675 RepID=UPI0031EE3648
MCTQIITLALGGWFGGLSTAHRGAWFLLLLVPIGVLLVIQVSVGAATVSKSRDRIRSAMEEGMEAVIRALAIPCDWTDTNTGRVRGGCHLVDAERSELQPLAFVGPELFDDFRPISLRDATTADFAIVKAFNQGGIVKSNVTRRVNSKSGVKVRENLSSVVAVPVCINENGTCEVIGTVSLDADVKLKDWCGSAGNTDQVIRHLASAAAELAAGDIRLWQH